MEVRTRRSVPGGKGPDDCIGLDRDVHQCRIADELQVAARCRGKRRAFSLEPAEKVAGRGRRRTPTVVSGEFGGDRTWEIMRDARDHFRSWIERAT